MKKIIILIVAVLVLIVVGYFVFSKKTQAPTDSSQNILTPDTQDAVKSGIKNSLMTLIKGSTGVKCAVEDATGKYTIIAKDEKVRIEGIDFVNPASEKNSDQKGTMISDGIWVYMWNGKEGLKFNIRDMEATGATQDENVAKDSDWQTWVKSMDASGAKHDCKPELATDKDFTPPSDVKFTDWNEMLKGLQEMQANPGAFDPAKLQMPE